MKLSLEGRVEVRYRTEDSFQAEFDCKDTQRRWMLFWSLRLEWGRERERRLRVEWTPHRADMGALPMQVGEMTGPVPLEPLLDKSREEAVQWSQ